MLYYNRNKIYEILQLLSQTVCPSGCSATFSRKKNLGVEVGMRTEPLFTLSPLIDDGANDKVESSKSQAR